MKLVQSFYYSGEEQRAKGSDVIYLRVEREEGDTGETEFELAIVTVDFILKSMRDANKPYYYHWMPMLVVAEFKEDVIDRAISEILPRIDKIARPTG